MKFYRRRVLSGNGTIYEGRWSKSKVGYMQTAKHFCKGNIKAVADWEELTVENNAWNFFWEDEEDNVLLDVPTRRKNYLPVTKYDDVVYGSGEEKDDGL